MARPRAALGRGERRGGARSPPRTSTGASSCAGAGVGEGPGRVAARQDGGQAAAAPQHERTHASGSSWSQSGPGHMRLCWLIRSDEFPTPREGASPEVSP